MYLGAVAGLADLERLLPSLDLVRQILVDDPQVGNIMRDPLGFEVGSERSAHRSAGPGRSAVVPDALPDLHLVIEDAGCLLPAGMDRAGAPAFAEELGTYARLNCLRA